MVRHGSRGVGAVVLLVVVLALTPGGSALGTTTDAGMTVSDTSWQASPPANNSTTTPPHQENPDEVGEDGDAQAMADWLSSRLSERLGDSAVQISQGQYEDAQGLLGDQYDDTLSKYIDVAGETDSETDTQQADQYEDARDTQAEYIESVSEYRETHDAYQEARRNGNGERARELARELRALAGDIDSLTASLTGSYQNLSARSEHSFQDETRVIENTTRTITEQTEVAVTDVFTATALTIEVDSPGSFVDPVEISGRVTANESTPLNGTIQVRIHDQVLRTAVEEDGTFELSYRPLTAPTGTLDGAVAYVPAPDGVYLGSSTSMQVNVTQTEPSLQVADAPATARYQESIAVTGQVTAAGRPIPNATVHLQVADRHLAQTQTNASGHYEFAPALPDQVAAGTQPLTVRVGAAGTALTPTTKQTALTITETETQLSLVTRQDGETIQVRGRLHSPDGNGIHNHSVTITRNGAVVDALQTNASGYITTAIPAPDAYRANASVRVGAAFNGTGTNLQSARASTTVRLTGIGPTSGSLPLTLLVLAGGGVLALGGVTYAVLRYRSTDDDSTATPEASDPTHDAPAGEPATPPGAADVPAQLAMAADALEEEAVERAVRSLYGAARTAYSPGDAVARTHWEFFTTVKDDLSPAAQDTLRALTEAYEAVQFADDPPTQDDVTALLEATQTQLADRGPNRNPHQPPAQSDE